MKQKKLQIKRINVTQIPASALGGICGQVATLNPLNGECMLADGSSWCYVGSHCGAFWWFYTI
jgi:hypothetical protein